MPPAQQRLDAGNRAAVGLDDRLVVHLESARGERAGGLALDQTPLLELGFHLDGVGNRRAAAAALGSAQRQIGAARELVAAGAVAGRHRKSDADADLDDLVHPDRAGERLA